MPFPKQMQYLPVFFLAFLWAAYGPLLRFFEGISLDVFAINFFGFLGGTVFLLAIFAVQKTSIHFPDKNESKKLLLYALSLCSTNVFLFFAFTQTTLANTILIHYTGLFWAAIAAVFFFQEKLSKWKTISALFAIAGIFLIFLPQATVEEKYFTGNFFALLSSFGYAGVVLASRSLKDSEPKKNAFYATLFCAAIFAPLFFVFGSPQSLPTLLAPFSINGIYAVFEVLFLIYGMATVGIIIASIILVLEIPVTALFGLVLYNEVPSVQTVAGGIMIVTGVILLIVKEKATKV